MRVRPWDCAWIGTSIRAKLVRKWTSFLSETPPSLPLTAVEVKVTSLKMLPFMDALASVPREYAPVRIDNSSVSLLASIWLAQISQDFCCGLGEALFENSSHDEVVEFEIPS